MRESVPQSPKPPSRPLLNRLLRRRGNGWLPDAPDKRDRDIDKLGLGAPVVRDRVSLRDRVLRVLNQGFTNTCVVNGATGAWCVALETAMRVGTIEREEIVLPSRLFIYHGARGWTGDEDVDLGTYNRNGVKTMRRIGMPDEEFWPFKVSKVNKQPSWKAYQHAHDRRGPAGYYRIFDASDGRIEAIIAALHAGHPVLFGTEIDRFFGRDGGPMTVERPARSDTIGGHAIVIVGYYIDPDFGLVFEILNSYGKNYRDGGFVYFTEEYIRWALSRDFWVFAVV